MSTLPFNTRVPIKLAIIALFTFPRAGVPAGPSESAATNVTRKSILSADLHLQIYQRVTLRELLETTLPEAVKEATGRTVTIKREPRASITYTSWFGPFVGKMTLEGVLNEICNKKWWGWYVNSAPGDAANDGAILLTTNPDQRGYKVSRAKIALALLAGSPRLLVPDRLDVLVSPRCRELIGFCGGLDWWGICGR